MSFRAAAVSLLLILGSGLSTGQIKTTKPAAGPKLVILGGTKFDFGEISKGSTATHTVVLRNDGTAPLTISKVTASCGCTGAMMSSSTLEPRQSGNLEITFDGSRFNGKVEKSVSFQTNDPMNANVQINFTATVSEVLEITPKHIFFKDIPADSPASQEVTVSNGSMSTVKLTSVSASASFLTARFADSVLAPSGSTTLTCTFRGPPAGIHRGSIFITTASKRMPRMEIKVFAYVKGPAKAVRRP